MATHYTDLMSRAAALNAVDTAKRIVMGTFDPEDLPGALAALIKVENAIRVTPATVKATKGQRFRSAITGLFITKKAAAADPAHTVAETV